MTGARLLLNIYATITKYLPVDGRPVDYSFGINDGTNQLTPNGAIVFANGTGDGNVNANFIYGKATAAGATDVIDISDGSVKDLGGAPIAMTKIKFLYLSIEAPGGTIVFGPQGGTNVLKLNFNGITSNDKLTVTNAHLIVDATGWVVDSTDKNLIFTNPGASPVNWILVGAGEE